MRKCYHYLLFLFLCTVFCASSAHAQTGKGTITGIAKDEANSALASALIEVQPLGRKVASDDQGQFRITDVPVGEYTLTASYVGFAPFSMTVKVEAGRTANETPAVKGPFVSDQGRVTPRHLQREPEAPKIELIRVE